MLLKWVSCVFRMVFDQNKNPGKNFFALNNTHFSDINRYITSSRIQILKY